MTTSAHIDAVADGVVAVHIAANAVWCSARTSRGGQHRVTRTDMDVDPLRHVDDYVVSIGGVDVPTPDAVSRCIRQALVDNGLTARPSLLILTHPPHWGELRRGVLYSAARPLAAEVVLVDSAEVATQCVASERRDTFAVIVVDGCPTRASVAAVSGRARRSGVCRLVDGIATDPGSVSDSLRRAVQEVSVSAHPALAVLHDASESVTRDDVETASTVPVVEVSGSDLVTALLDTGVDSEGPPTAPRSDPGPPIATRAPAWLAARTVPKTRGERIRETVTAARVGIGLALVVVLAVTAACAWWFGSPSEQVTPAAAPSSPPKSTTAIVPAMPDSLPPPVATPPASTPPESTPAVRPPTALTLGRVTLAVPDGWHTEPGAERVDFLPDNGSGMRITLVSRELDDEFGGDDVVATLQRQFAGTENGGRFDQLRTDVSVAGRQGLTYVESPSDGSTVEWSVVVSPRLQLSVGCQSTDARHDEMAEVCGAVLDSLVVADA